MKGNAFVARLGSELQSPTFFFEFRLDRLDTYEKDVVAVAIKIHRDVQNTRKKKETGI